MARYWHMSQSMLHEFIIAHREELVGRTRAKVAARESPRVTDDELRNGVPTFLAQLTEALVVSSPDSSRQISLRAAAHGGELQRMGFTVSQVVHGYGDVCQAITELATETGAPITNDEFHTLNGLLDDAIAMAVSEFARQKENALTKTATERLGFFAHELRNLLSTALLSYEMMRKGTVGIGGSTAAVLQRALLGLNGLVDRSLSEVRLEAGIAHREVVSLLEVVNEIEAAASLEATALGQQLTVIGPVDRHIMIEVDRHILGSVVSNLLQNAFKFTPQGRAIILRTRATIDRVLIEVEDTCGGLPPGRAEELFAPFERRSNNRTGLGLGLSICREGTHANGGELRVRDVPGHGCVFSVELPRLRRA